MVNSMKTRLVSELTTPDALKHSEDYRASYLKQEFIDLMEAVGKTLRDVKFHVKNSTTAVVYRSGDIHALGEVGYKNTKSKSTAEPTYYVESRRITNEKYRAGNWQRHIVTTKSLANAVKAASTYLTPFTCEESVSVTKDTARQIITDTVNTFSSAAKRAYKDLTGQSSWVFDISSEFIAELRGHRFVSPSMQHAADSFYKAYDLWKDAETVTKSGAYYIGVSDNYGQQVVDSAKVTLGYPYTQECYERMNAEAVADWVKGRIAVLSMVPPLHYVQGVGVRLDDRVFYVIEQAHE